MATVEARRRAIKNYAKNHPDRINEQQRKRYAKNPVKHRKRFLVWKTEHPKEYAFSFYRRNSRDRGLVFNISKDEFDRLVSIPCRYCGSVPNTIGGIDRVNNDLGYIEGNVVPCCAICNRAKRSMAEDDFLDWFIRAAKHVLALTEERQN